MPFIHTVRPMGTSLRALAALLSYPGAELRDHLAELRARLHDERALGAERLAELDALIDALVRADALDAEAAYVDCFDRGRSTSLHLFEHVHGDSRERGPALVDLGRTYAEAGLVLADGELPDYLPVVLEFASTQPPAQARAFLGEMAHILGAVFAALRERGSAYASVLGALLDLAGEKALPVTPAKRTAESLDESWEEPLAFDGCSTQGQARPGQAQPIHVVRRDGSRPQPGARA